MTSRGWSSPRADRDVPGPVAGPDLSPVGHESGRLTGLTIQYDGKVFVGIAADAGLVPDHAQIVDGFADAFRRLSSLSVTSGVETGVPHGARLAPATTARPAACPSRRRHDP